MKKTNKVTATIELVAVLSFALVLGACTQRSPIPLYDGTLSSGSFGCQVYVNPSPVPVRVDGAGNIPGTKPTVTLAVMPSQPAQIVSMSVSNPAGLQLQAFGLPSASMSQFSIQAQALLAVDNSVNFTIKSSSGETVNCPSANVTFNKTTSAPSPGSLKFQMSGDVNGDTINDQVAWDASTGYWWVIVGSASTSGAYANWGVWGSSQNWVNVTLLDINGDGKKDVVGRDLNSGNWWAGVSTGGSFSNLYLGNFTTSTTWTNVKFGPNSQGVISVFGTDGNGIQYQLTLNASQGNPGVLTALPPLLNIGVSASYGVTPAAFVNVPFNGSAYVSWNALSATGCAVFTGSPASPSIIAQGSSGSFYLMTNLTASTTVYLGCNGAGTSQTAPAAAQIQVGTAPSPILSLSAPGFATKGSSVTATWAATNVTVNSCTMSANGVNIPLPSGSTSGNVTTPVITMQTTLILNCNAPAPYGAQTKSQVIAIQALPGSSPGSLQFSANVGATTAPQPYTLTSANNITTILSIDMPSPSFQYNVSSCGPVPFDIPQGGTCTLPVKFNPAAAIQYSGALKFNYQTKGFPASAATSPGIPLSGTGITVCSGKSC